MRLDYKEKFPSGMEEYLEYYGWHFSKKMCEWATSKMFKFDLNERKVEPKRYTKEQLETLMKRFGINVPFSYDALYVANMCSADFLGSSVIDEQHLAMYVKNVINDPDAYDGMVFTRFYADCIGSGTPIDWEDMI